MTKNYNSSQNIHLKNFQLGPNLLNKNQEKLELNLELEPIIGKQLRPFFKKCRIQYFGEVGKFFFPSFLLVLAFFLPVLLRSSY